MMAHLIGKARAHASLLVLSSVLLTAAIVAACNREAEQAATDVPTPPSQTTPAATVAGSVTPVNPDVGTAVPPPTPLPSPVLIPADWPLYQHPQHAEFQFRFPAAWTAGSDGFTVYS